MATHLHGIRPRMRAESIRMLATGVGRMINSTQILGPIAARYETALCRAKHAVVGLTKAAEPDHIKARHRVTAIRPGDSRPPMIDRVVERPQGPRGGWSGSSRWPE